MGGTTRIGTARTVSVRGRYWISSSCSVRRTTDPGVAAMLRPIWNDDPSTICGTRGALTTSRSRLTPPRTKFTPAVSTAALADDGFTNGTLLGDSASVRLSTSTRARSSSRLPRSASVTSRPAVAVAAR